MKKYNLILAAVFGAAVFGLSGISAFAQRAPEPPKLQLLKPSKIQDTKLPADKQSDEPLVVIPFHSNDKMLAQIYEMEISETPDLLSFAASCHEIHVTKKAYLFQCVNMGNSRNDPNNFATFILRRDGTEPDWAMNADDFEYVTNLLKDPETASLRLGTLGRRNIDGSSVSYIYNTWGFYTLKNYQAPPQYCSVNTKKYIVVPNRQGQVKPCFDLMAVKRRNQRAYEFDEEVYGGGN